MSAYCVPRSHIATLAAFALGGAHKISHQFGSMADVANKLASENAVSVNYRYPNDPAVGGEEFADDVAVWNAARLEINQPVAILKAVGSLEYQSCEHPDWMASEAYSILQQIKSAAIRMLPGYDDADWEIKNAQPGQQPQRFVWPWARDGEQIPKDSRAICTVWACSEVDRDHDANAQLIAQAPDMAQALLDLIPLARDGHGSLFEDGECPAVDRAREILRQAGVL
jgi:hypothetical protein